MILLGTSFKNRPVVVVLLLGAVLEGFGLVLESLGGVLVRLVSILGRYWNRLRSRVERGLTSWTVLEVSSKLFRVWDQFLMDFWVIVSLRLGVISLTWEASK